MNIIQKPINDLISAEYNPRQLSKDQYKQIKDSISRFGLVDPIIINKNKERKNIIVGGHQRVKVATDLDYKEVPCIEVDLTYDKERELNIRLNKNTGDWDYDILADMFEMDDLQLWGFSEEDLVGYAPEEIKIGKTDDDAIPEDVDPICKLGQLYQLGEHRLLCGDAAKKEDVELLLDGNKADMVFTDPPYNVDYGEKNNPTKYKDRGIKNDNMSKSEWHIFSTKYIKNIIDYCDGNIYICMSDKELGHLQNVFIENGGKWSSFIIWVKDSLIISQKDYHSRHETILYGWRDGLKNRYRIKDRKQDDVWEIDRYKKNDLHPTMKPINLMIKAVQNSSKTKDIILDIFIGSGSTLIACEKTNRKCYGMEIDPHYCDVIIKRWEDYTGQKAELIGKT